MIDKSGAAFPFMRLDGNGEIDWANINNGMTLRDYFAGQALASGLCPHNVYSEKAVSEWCYTISDAMIAERNK